MNRHNLLYFCDFPPCNYVGGPTLMSRLLKEYPAERIIVLTSSHANNSYPQDGRLRCKHIAFLRLNATGKLGLGRLKGLLNKLLLPALPLVGVRVIKRYRIRTILTVAHGYFFLAAAVASWLTSIPLILIVHDDWVSTMQGISRVHKRFCPGIFRIVTGRANHIYSVSTSMRELLRTQYGVESELQMPATEPVGTHAPVETDESDDLRKIRIVYAGAGTGSDGLDLLIRTIKGGKLREYGIDSSELHLFMQVTQAEGKERGWESECITIHGWVSQAAINSALAAADILYLPLPFEEKWKFVASAFPTKTSDYLISGKPILICAPSYSSIARYGKEYGFAEVVDEPTEEALARGFSNICRSKEYRKKLLASALLTFERNHNIVKQRSSFMELVDRVSHQGSNGSGENLTNRESISANSAYDSRRH